MKNTALSRTLRRWRAAAGLTQSQAAEQLGRSLRTIQQWEQSRAVPRGGALSALERQIANATTKNNQ